MLRTEEKDISHPGAERHPKAHIQIFFSWSNNHVNMYLTCRAILAASIVFRHHSGLLVFQQNGALPHFAHSVHNYLNETFPGRWIWRASPRFWAARSRDLTLLDFFAGVHINIHVIKVKIRICSTCVNAFRQHCKQLPQQCCSMFSDAPRREFNSAWIRRAIMSNCSYFINLRCLLPHYKHLISNEVLIPRNG